jgi:hypothetical protein
MIVTLQAVRVYGSKSQYGDIPRSFPSESPFIVPDFPRSGERGLVYLGEIPTEILQASRVRWAIGRKMSGVVFSSFERDIAIDEILKDVEAYPFKVTDNNWYVVLIIECSIQVSDTEVNDNKYIWLTNHSVIQVKSLTVCNSPTRVISRPTVWRPLLFQASSPAFPRPRVRPGRDTDARSPTRQIAPRTAP